MYKQFIKLLFITLVSINVLNASKKVDACVKYKKEYAWSKGYELEVTVISGFDLNNAVGSISKFDSLSTYAVIFWEKEQATILKLPPLSIDSIPILESVVKDQYGREWKIKEGHILCY